MCTLDISPFCLLLRASKISPNCSLKKGEKTEMTSSHGRSLAATHPPSVWRTKNGMSSAGVTGRAAQGGPMWIHSPWPQIPQSFRNITLFTRSLSGPIQFDPESREVHLSSDMAQNGSVLSSGLCNITPVRFGTSWTLKWCKMSCTRTFTCTYLKMFRFISACI